MTLVSLFLEIVQHLSSVMTTSNFADFVAILSGWIFARRRILVHRVISRHILYKH